jgi:plasmid maintenance system killer protein
MMNMYKSFNALAVANMSYGTASHMNMFETSDKKSTLERLAQQQSGNAVCNEHVSVGNMVDLSYANPEAEAECTPGNPNYGKRIPENFRVLEKQLKRLEKAVTLQELKGDRELRGIRDNQGNFHALKNDLKGMLACALHNGWRLVFTPKNDPIPYDANGKLDWSKVDAVEIQGIIDYH